MIDLNEIAKKSMIGYSPQQMMESCASIVIPRFFNLYLEPLISHQETLSISMRSDWSKLLSDVDQNEGQLGDIIAGAWGVYGGNDGDYIGLNTNRIFLQDGTESVVDKSCVMVWAGCSTIIQLNRFGNLIQRVLGNKYRVEVLNSETTSNKQIEDKINKVVIPQCKKDGKRLVIVSKLMGARSFSVPELATEFLMYDAGGIEATTQRISRVFTNGKDWNGFEKQYGNIVSFSFDPNREHSSPIDDYLLNESEKIENTELNNSIKRVLSSAYIFKKDENGMIIEFTYDEKETYSSQLVNSSSLLKVAEAGVNPNAISDDDLDINSVQLDKESTEERERSFKELEKKKSIKIGDKNDRTKKDKDEERTAYVIKREALKSVVKNLPELSIINMCENDDIVNMLDSIAKKGYDDEVIYEIGVDSKTIKRWVLQGAFNTKLMNTIISQYNISQKKYEEIFG